MHTRTKADDDQGSDKLGVNTEEEEAKVGSSVVRAEKFEIS